MLRPQPLLPYKQAAEEFERIYEESSVCKWLEKKLISRAHSLGASASTSAIDVQSSRPARRNSSSLLSPPAELFQQIKAEKMRRLSMQAKLKHASSADNSAVKPPVQQNLFHSFKVLQECTNNATNRRHDESKLKTSFEEVKVIEEEEEKIVSDHSDEEEEKEKGARSLCDTADHLIASVDKALKNETCFTRRRSGRLQMQEAKKSIDKINSSECPRLCSKKKRNVPEEEKLAVSIGETHLKQVCFSPTLPSFSSEQKMDSADCTESRPDGAVLSGHPPEEAFVLDEWTLRLVKKGVVVEGHLRGHAPDDFWHSSVISKRLSAKVIVTSQGSKYTLCGCMDHKDARSNGFPEALIKAFKSGFPRNWQELIETHWLANDLSKKKKKKMKAEEKRVIRPTPKRTPSNHLNVSSSSVDSTKLFDMGTLPTSRSGRKLIPQLPWWTNQRVVLYKQTDEVMVLPGSVDTLSFDEKKMSERNPLLKSRKRKKIDRKGSCGPQEASSQKEQMASDTNKGETSAHDSPCGQLFLPDQNAPRDPVPGQMEKISLYEDIHEVLKSHRTERQHRRKRKTCYSDEQQTAPLLQSSPLAASFAPLDVLQSANRKRSSLSQIKSSGLLPCVPEEDDCLTQSFEGTPASAAHREQKNMVKKKRKHHRKNPNIAQVIATEKDVQKTKLKVERKKQKPQTHQPLERVLPSLTAGKGTIKRKRQIRDLIEHHEKDHNDNPFGATPFKKTKAFNLPAHLLDSSEPLGHVSGVETLLKTPRPDWMQDSSSSAAAAGLSTPFSSMVSPGILKSVDRNAADRYMNRLKKVRDVKTGTLLRPAQTPTSVRSLQVLSSLDPLTPNESLFKMNTFSDNASDEDYYFTDS